MRVGFNNIRIERSAGKKESDEYGIQLQVKICNPRCGRIARGVARPLPRHLAPPPEGMLDLCGQIAAGCPTELDVGFRDVADQPRGVPRSARRDLLWNRSSQTCRLSQHLPHTVAK